MRKEFKLTSQVAGMVFWAVLVASAVLLAVFWFRRGKDLPPGPAGFPVIGCLPRLDPKNPHLTFTKLSKEYGGIYSLQLGSVFTGRCSESQEHSQRITAITSFFSPFSSGAERSGTDQRGVVVARTRRESPAVPDSRNHEWKR